ncbi:MAG: acetyl esterase/lipase [Cellvibrionaceae bacterium]|jgi:acetyl esterase/lipase
MAVSTFAKITLKFSKLGTIVFSLFSLQGCALQFLDWATPNTGYQVEKNIAYGTHNRQRIDVYKPTTPSAQNITILFFYGGSWEEGSKDKYRFVAQALAEKGHQVVVADYRVYPEVLFPGFMSDAAQALAWAADHLDQPIVLMGHSAGAHIAAMLALDSLYTSEFNVDAKRVIGLIGLSGPYDFLPLKRERLKTIFNAADDIQNTQPINFVTSSAPPALLVHGLADTAVLPFNTKNLAKKLSDNGVNVTMKLYPDKTHGVTVGALSVPFRKQLPILEDIQAFLATL